MKQSLRDLDVKGKRVLVRVDYNVPLSEDGTIENDKRIRETLDTIQDLRKRGARVILLTHLGRPEGKVVEELSTRSVVRHLGKLLGDESVIVHVPYIVGARAEEATRSPGPNNSSEGHVLVMENLRFDPREKQNDPAFAKELAALGDLYVNEAFAVSHRAHASIVGIPQHLPSAMGLGFENEVQHLTAAIESPERPLHVMFGGVKVETRLPMIDNFLTHVGAEKLYLGGAMANTFLVAQGYNAGASVYEESLVQKAKELMEEYRDQLVFPVDVVVASERADDVDTQTVFLDAIPDGTMVLDIGPSTVKYFAETFADAKTIIWNGPMGAFEYKPFIAGTEGIAKALANLSATTIIGGGDTGAVLEQLGYANKMTFVSTGGGAALTFFEGNSLPGIEALQDVSAK